MAECRCYYQCCCAEYTDVIDRQALAELLSAAAYEELEPDQIADEIIAMHSGGALFLKSGGSE